MCECYEASDKDQARYDAYPIKLVILQVKIHRGEENGPRSQSELVIKVNSLDSTVSLLILCDRILSDRWTWEEGEYGQAKQEIMRNFQISGLCKWIDMVPFTELQCTVEGQVITEEGEISVEQVELQLPF